MGHILSHPVQSKNLQRFGDAKCRIGVAEMQGFRTNMEDAHQVCLSLKNHENMRYIGMFDGHNGHLAAEWMAKEMGDRLSALSDPTNHREFAETVEKADADFMSNTNVRVHGSTACMVILTQLDETKRKVTVANVGDSRCLVIAPDGTVRYTTVDHKPEVEGETKRILEAGGSVSFGRVDGDLAMSRSIGDYAYKNVGHLSALDQKVIPTPDVDDFELAPNDFLLVCCDGLVEKLTNAQVAQFIVEQVEKQKKEKGEIDPALVMAALLDYSLQKGSKDNMSAALLVPIDGSSFTRDDEYIVGPYSEWANDRVFVDAFMADGLKHGYSREKLLELVAKQNQSAATANAANAIKKETPILLG